MGVVDFDPTAWQAAKGPTDKPTLATLAALADGSEDDALVAFDETAGALEFDHYQPRSVAEAVASLAHMPPPSSLPMERWRQMINDAATFASTRWAEAEANGWTVLQIFGVSPGFARRLDCDGLVAVLAGREVGTITPDYIAILAGADVLRFRRTDCRGSVSMWEAA